MTNTRSATRTVRFILQSLLSCLAVTAVFGTGRAARAQVTLAENGKARCVIVRQAGATEAERHAADELAATLHQMTGATFSIRDTLPSGDGAAILVGPGKATAAAFPDVDLTKFREEESIQKTSGKRLLLAGGRTRGTLYAVYRFLQEACGVRWWAPWATDIPLQTTLKIATRTVRESPAFEYREPYWFPAFDGDWAVHNGINGETQRLTAAQGGKVVYTGGFVHTSYALVPPDRYFAPHPEWYALIDGKRTVDNAQLCLTNPALRDFVVQRVRKELRAAPPDARIVSISQNDNVRYCQCAECTALDTKEGSHASSMLAFVNYIAEKLGPEFPNIAFDTLAYQYTRHPPKTLRPLPNVIIRLCSIECNFGEPLDHPTNAAFYKDLTDWSKICGRLYVWDYTTDFANYIQPHPNWFTLGADMRLFQKNHVQGIFSEGAYESSGGEMSEMRAWVLSRLMWNPAQDDKALITEFLRGYYGKNAAPFIQRYFDTMQKASRGYYLGCYTPTSAPFLDLPTLTAAENLWNQAEAASKNDPTHLWRVRQGHLPVRYVFLTRWQTLRAMAQRKGTAWPLPESRKAVADEWKAVATGPGPAGWKPVTHVHEGSRSVDAFLARFAQEPLPPSARPPRGASPPPPADLAAQIGADAFKRAVDLQDDVATLYEEGDLSEIRGDPNASDGLAVHLPGSHHEWAFQIHSDRIPSGVRAGKWKVYVVLRAEMTSKPRRAQERTAFTAGIWDTNARALHAEIHPSVADVEAAAGSRYHSYLLGSLTLTPGDYIWVAPAANPAVTAVWVDRVYLVPE